MKLKAERKWKQYILGIISLVSVVLFPGIFLYCQNVDVSKFREIWQATGEYLGIALLVALVWGIILRDYSKTIFMSQISMLYLMNFNNIHRVVEKYNPTFHRSIELLIGGMILLLLALLIKKKMKGTTELFSIVGLVFYGLIIFNVVVASPKIMKRFEVARQKKNSPEIVASELADYQFVDSDKPNVYYFVLDEYAGFENIERYYEYDNKDFEVYLLDESFNISYGSHNTEGIFTYAILPNLLNLDYVVSMDMDELDCWERTRNPALYQLFWNNGYHINLINHLGDLKTDGCTVLNEGVEKETLSDYLVEDGVLDFIHDYLNPTETYYGKMLYDTLQLMITCGEYTSKDEPTFTMVYMICPHAPFALDENGSCTSPEAYRNFINRTLYTNQLKFLNKCLEETINNIKENDPNALIIIQSDHGGRYPYQMQEEYGVPYDATIETIYMQNILNCVYYKGQEIEIEGLSGINTLRKVLNEVFGTEYDLIENPPIWQEQL